MWSKHNLILGLAKACLALALLGAIVGPVAHEFAGGRVAFADNKGKGKGNGNGHGNGKSEEKANKDRAKKEKKAKKHGDEEPVVVAPNVTPVPAPVQPTATSVPDQAGALRVVAMSCQTRPADGADWMAACTAAVAGARYDLLALDGPLAEWHRDLLADASGIATINRLPAARYRLDQKNDDWCRAESDRVDAAGDVVIQGGDTTTVWVFNCLDGTSVAT